MTKVTIIDKDGNEIDMPWTEIGIYDVDGEGYLAIIGDPVGIPDHDCDQMECTSLFHTLYRAKIITDDGTIECWRCKKNIPSSFPYCPQCGAKKNEPEWVKEGKMLPESGGAWW
jgi:hypothetical protein